MFVTCISFGVSFFSFLFLDFLWKLCYSLLLFFWQITHMLQILNTHFISLSMVWILVLSPYPFRRPIIIILITIIVIQINIIFFWFLLDFGLILPPWTITIIITIIIILCFAIIIFGVFPHPFPIHHFQSFFHLWD